MNRPRDNEPAGRPLECGDLSPLPPVATRRGGSAGLADANTSEPLDAVLVARQVGQHQSDVKSPHSKGAASPVDHSKKPWPHAPVHKLSEHGVFFVTAGTLHKEHLFAGPERLTLLETRLLELAKQYHWQVEAWAAFPNHYHFVARANPDSAKLDRWITHLHADTARKVNQLDVRSGRKVWFNFRDTKLTFERSYLARLNYVHQNAVKHGLVAVVFRRLVRAGGNTGDGADDLQLQDRQGGGAG